jgi:hypothetical protein
MEAKTCTLCKRTKPFDFFQQIIKRQTFAPYTDDDGYEYYMKETKMCICCRDVQNATCKRYRRRKYQEDNDIKK